MKKRQRTIDYVTWIPNEKMSASLAYPGKYVVHSQQPTFHTADRRSISVPVFPYELAAIYAKASRGRMSQTF